MAFGVMTRKWGILQRPALVAPHHWATMMETIAQLHNYCINSTDDDFIVEATADMFDAANTDPNNGMSNHTEPMLDENGNPIEGFDGESMMRFTLVERVRAAGMARPE
jgi:hypothetical protein